VTWIAIHVTRFDQRDRRICVFGETTCNDEAGSARANKDNVVFFQGHQCLSHSRHLCRGAHMSGGMSHRRALIIVDNVPPEPIGAATHDVARCAVHVHDLAVRTCSVN
jgi:hypothetical protein